MVNEVINTVSTWFICDLVYCTTDLFSRVSVNVKNSRQNRRLRFFHKTVRKYLLCDFAKKNRKMLTTARN